MVFLIKCDFINFISWSENCLRKIIFLPTQRKKFENQNLFHLPRILYYPESTNVWALKFPKKKILKIAIYIKLFKFKRKWKLRLRKDASDVQLVAQINRTYLHACNAWLYLFSVLGVRERWGHRWLEATANANSKMPHFRSRIALF